MATDASFWLLAPQRPDAEPSPATAGGAAARGIGSPDDDRSRLGPLLALGAVGIGVLLLLSEAGVRSGPVGAAPLLVIGLGVAVLWRVGDDAQRAEEDSMIAEVDRDNEDPAPRRDPEEVALELLQTELGARRIEG